MPKVFTQVSDKLLHFIVFFVFGMLLYRGLEPRTGTTGFSGRRALLAVTAVIVYGVSDELHQGFVPGRTLDLWDAVSDGVGGAVAMVCLFVFYRFQRQKEDAPA